VLGRVWASSVLLLLLHVFFTHTKKVKIQSYTSLQLFFAIPHMDFLIRVSLIMLKIESIITITVKL